ncbi:hypothetical protein GWK47_005985 [Chionoecetes opilio]|uniref:Uncharacterized protein n=1 Tax=Chionoecetes opilio TaxID=41210 RepID=A0A8J5CVA5_CHIOP|nr:hypothetical protein GWK47_005985 [Chionoecetes opilio]
MDDTVKDFFGRISGADVFCLQHIIHVVREGVIPSTHAILQDTAATKLIFHWSHCHITEFIAAFSHQSITSPHTAGTTMGQGRKKESSPNDTSVMLLLWLQMNTGFTGLPDLLGETLIQHQVCGTIRYLCKE